MTTLRQRIASAIITCAALALVALPASADDTLIPDTKIPLIQPTLVVSNESDLSVAQPGDLVTFTVTIMNVGNGSTGSIALHATLPEGFTLSSNGASQYDYSFVTPLEPQKKVSASYTAILGSGVPAGTYSSTATVTASSIDSLTSTATVLVHIPETIEAVRAEEISSAVDYSVPSLVENEPRVLGASDELTATGVGQLDVLLALLGSWFVAIGTLGLVQSLRP